MLVVGIGDGDGDGDGVGVVEGGGTGGLAGEVVDMMMDGGE